MSQTIPKSASDLTPDTWYVSYHRDGSMIIGWDFKTKQEAMSFAESKEVLELCRYTSGAHIHKVPNAEELAEADFSEKLRLVIKQSNYEFNSITLLYRAYKGEPITDELNQLFSELKPDEPS